MINKISPLAPKILKSMKPISGVNIYTYCAQYVYIFTPEIGFIDFKIFGAKGDILLIIRGLSLFIVFLLL